MSRTRTGDEEAAATPGDIGTGACQSEHVYFSDKSRFLSRLKPIEGQARGIHSMVEESSSASTSSPRSAP